jgi:hypothetical protein
MKYKYFLIAFTIISCNNEADSKKNYAILSEEESMLPISEPFKVYSHFTERGIEYLNYMTGEKIYTCNLNSKAIEDSFPISSIQHTIDKFGEISSICNQGMDTMFILFDKAIILYVKKKLERTIPINTLDTVQYNGIKFTNLENAPISYNKYTNEVIGQLYSTKYSQTDSFFYKVGVIGKINILTGRLTITALNYPDKFKEKYYGFSNRVYISSIDSLTAVSFSCDQEIYLLNQNNGKITSFSGKSYYQKNEPLPLPPTAYQSREEKMKHLIVSPQYFEIRFNPNLKLYYRFFRKEISIKNEKGLYNSLEDKGLVLTVFDSKFKLIGEYELDKYYIDFISFPSKQGLYINYISKNPEHKNKKVFKILNFQ